MSHLDGAELDQWWDFGDPAGSEAVFREKLAHLTSPAREELQTQIARSLGLQQRFEEGHALLNTVESTDAVVLQRTELERGRLWNSAGNSDTARDHFLTAVANGADEFLTVDALHMLAIVEPSNREWYEQAMRIVEESGDARVRRWEGSLRNNHAWNLADAGDEVAALVAFREAEQWFNEHGTASQIHVARWSVAHLLRRLGFLSEARVILEDLKANSEEDRYVDEELALLINAE